ncbi:MAG: hypothetical protein HOM07_14475 [Rhodospirillaceae bacterium]|jgi:hypothetical protein|nr:hypothetical protein [Rhodospirillaceae bacterium]MBT5456470.1 hypothetical protein [Rhodospirillaceae bacterium]
MRTFVSTAALIFAIILIYSAKARTVTITESDCSNLVRHVPSDDVAYKPGVDAKGRPVVPADLGGGVQIKAPTEFSIPITMDLQKRLGIPVDPNSFQTQNFAVGTVTWKDGRGYFNGQPLQSAEAERLAALCQERLKTGG